VRYARSRRPDIHIVARASDRVHVYELYQAGANDIVRETFDSSIRAGRYVLENMGFSEYEAAKVSQAYFRIDRAAMRDLAKAWVPGQPVYLNEAYVERAKQLDRDLENALMEELHDVSLMAPEDDLDEGAPEAAPEDSPQILAEPSPATKPEA
jgi:monovalent cation:H+ antiporter-2, CPA2 family